MDQFSAEIKLLGINPYVFVPEEILQNIFQKAGKDKGHIPIKGTVNGQPYQQTLVRYSGDWRLYINTKMLKNSPKRIGETIHLTISFDPETREIEAVPDFVKALAQNKDAKAVYDQLPASRRLEIDRYLARLKTPEALQKNIGKAINFLLGKERFVGRDQP